MKRFVLGIFVMLATAGAGLLLDASSARLRAQARPVVATVVKATGIPWFERMATGIASFAGANPGLSAFQTGPDRADAAQQRDVVEGLIARRVDALAVVPIDPTLMEDALGRAMDLGIVVVTHEADNQRHTHANVEAFDHASFGAALNERLARCMSERGTWTAFVGSLGSRTHRLWVEAGAANARKHAGMTFIDEANESFDNVDKAYERAKHVLRRYPDIRGFQGSSSSDVIGIARAVEELGLQGKVCVVGTGLPSSSARYLESGTIAAIGFWDPRDSGMAMNNVAKLLLERKPLIDATNLGVKGYEAVAVMKGPGRGVLVIGNAMVIADKETYKNYPF